MRAFIPFTVLAIILLLTACGGGSSSDSGSSSDNGSSSDTGTSPVPLVAISAAEATTESAAQNSKFAARDIRSLYTTIEYMNGTSSFTEMRCPTGVGSPAACTYSAAGLDATDHRYVKLAGEPTAAHLARLRATLDQFSFLALNIPSVTGGYAKQGRTGTDIILIESTGQNADMESVSQFGAWMDYSGFYLHIVRSTSPSTTAIRAFGVGDRIYDRNLDPDDDTYIYPRIPPSSARYEGLMVGTSISGATEGNRLTGDALLEYRIDTSIRPADRGLDVTFSNIVNIDNMNADPIGPISFTNVHVSTGGQGFSQGANDRPLPDDYIWGNFYGSATDSLDEVTGAFKKGSIVGAFGAKKQ